MCAELSDCPDVCHKGETSLLSRHLGDADFKIKQILSLQWPVIQRDSTRGVLWLDKATADLIICVCVCLYHSDTLQPCLCCLPVSFAGVLPFTVCCRLL